MEAISCTPPGKCSLPGVLTLVWGFTRNTTCGEEGRGRTALAYTAPSVGCTGNASRKGNAWPARAPGNRTGAAAGAPSTWPAAARLPDSCRCAGCGTCAHLAAVLVLDFDGHGIAAALALHLVLTAALLHRCCRCRRCAAWLLLRCMGVEEGVWNSVSTVQKLMQRRTVTEAAAGGVAAEDWRRRRRGPAVA